MFAHKITADGELRLLEQCHAEEFFNLIGRTRDQITPWTNLADGLDSVDDCREFIRESLHRLADNGSPLCGIWFKDNLAGMIDVSKISWRSGKAWISYWLNEEFQGKGLVTSAGKAVVGHLFALGLNRIELYAQPENLRSRAVAERLGFKYEGTMREMICRDGKFADRVIQSLLPEEWDGPKECLAFNRYIGPDVEIRLPQPWDAEPLHGICEENRDYLRPWLRWAEEEQSVDESKKFLTHSLHALADESEVVWTIWYKGELAGLVGSSAIDRKNLDIEVGYWLGKGFDGKGLISMALTELLDHLFCTLDLHRVELYINPKNEPSKKVAKRFGFTHEATQRRSYLSDGVLVDMEVHGLLRQDWIEKKNT